MGATAARAGDAAWGRAVAGLSLTDRYQRRSDGDVMVADTCLSLRTSDVGEAQAFLDPRFSCSDMVPIEHGGALSARMTVTPLDDVTLSDVTFGAPLRVSFKHLDAYQVNVPLTGRLTTRQGAGEERVATPGTAALYQPEAGRVEDRWSADCRVVGVRIRPDALHRQLGAGLGPLGHEPLLSGPTKLLASWCRLVRWVHADAFGTRSLTQHPLIGGRLQEALVAGLLAVVNERSRDRLDAVGPAAPEAIRRIIDVVQAQPEEPYTLASLAEIAGLSPRAVQLGFRRHAGVTPMGFVRQTRLARVHDDLRRAERSSVTVATVAHRWGFVHLGRFAQLYRARYGVSPSETLRH